MSNRRRRLTPAEQYRSLWSSRTAPNLEEFIAGLAELTPDELLDVVETDRTERWRRGDRVLAERYLRDFPVLGNDVEAALVVVYGEFYLRKELGEAPSLMEYLARFPNHARRLRDQVMWHEAIELGTALNTGHAPPAIAGLAIGELLGRGGMCSVYKAVDELTGETVAIKVLDRDHLHHPMRVARFRREIGSLMRLRHPHIVAALRTGEAENVPYFIMEYCSGGTLSAQLAGKPLAPADATAVIRALASAVQYAHDQGVVHRDLKPGNVLLWKDKKPPGAGAAETDPSFLFYPLSYRPKVSDFGLAKCESGVGGSITATKETLGTPCYMAPELTTGARDADTRTDVYGLGGILYELLTGRPPFVATTPLEVVRLVREETPIPPTVLNPKVPAELEEVCLKCLQKEPEQRYAKAADVAAGVALPGVVKS